MIAWIKKNKLASVLLLIVAYFLVKPLLNRGVQPLYQRADYETGASSGGFASVSPKLSLSLPSFTREAAPTTQTDRLVVQESNLSLKVKNVRDSVDKIEEKAKALGGYMISSSLNQPEEAPYATISIRVPAKSLKEVLAFFRSLAIKVASENLSGYDVTDEYVDTEARLATLQKTKTKFEEILAQASKIPDLLEVQRELINLQDQIDSLKGRQQYLEKTSELARVTLYLSTDEYALPYAPAQPFRPAAIFKQAVRSLVSFVRTGIKWLIWIIVYAAIWVPAILIYRFFKRKFFKKTS